MHRNKGFTLIEILVVVAIIGILTSLGLAAINTAREKARIVAAASQLKQLRAAFTSIGFDTGTWPGREAAAGTPDPQPIGVRCAAPNNEVQDLSDPQSGILSNGGGYVGWNGPYMSTVPPDPWGRNYFFDTDYDIAPTGDTIFGAVIGSYGPNGVGNNLYDSDDVTEVLAQATCP